MLRAVALALTAILFAGGVVDAAPPASGSTPVRITGGTSRERPLLRSLVVSLHDPHVTLIRIGAPLRRFGYRGSAWFYATTRGADEVQLMKGAWQAKVLASLYSEVSHKRGMRRVAGISLTALRGKHAPVYVGSSALHDMQDVAHATPRRLLATIRRAALRVGMSVRSISFDVFGGGTVAVSVVVSAAGVGKEFRSYQIRASRLMEPVVAPPEGPPKVEGMYVTIVAGPQHRWIFAGAYASRSGNKTSTWR